MYSTFNDIYNIKHVHTERSILFGIRYVEKWHLVKGQMLSTKPTVKGTLRLPKHIHGLGIRSQG